MNIRRKMDAMRVWGCLASVKPRWQCVAEAETVVMTPRKWDGPKAAKLIGELQRTGERTWGISPSSEAMKGNRRPSNPSSRWKEVLPGISWVVNRALTHKDVQVWPHDNPEQKEQYPRGDRGRNLGHPSLRQAPLPQGLDPDPEGLAPVKGVDR
jgi:hypothetical protein